MRDKASINYKLSLIAKDRRDSLIWTQASLQLNVDDLNDNPPCFVNSSYMFIIMRKCLFGTYKGKVVAIDIDSSSFHRRVSNTLEAKTDFVSIDSLVLGRLLL